MPLSVVGEDGKLRRGLRLRDDAHFVVDELDSALSVDHDVIELDICVADAYAVHVS